MKNLILVIVALLVFIGGLGWFLFTSDNPKDPPTKTKVTDTYATKPVKGVFGMGVVQQTCYQDELVYMGHGKGDDSDVPENPCAGDLDMQIEFDFLSGWDDREWLENSLPLQGLKIPVNRRFRRLTLLEAYPLIQEAFLE